MIVQWYELDGEAYVISNVNTLLAVLKNVPEIQMVDARLKQFGLRRRGKWQLVKDWGAEAAIRKVP